MSVMVVMLATGCAATKNKIHQDANSYSNESWQFGTPTLDTRTPSLHFKKPVMIPVPAGANKQSKQQLSQAQGQQQQVQGAVVVPDVSSICSTCDVQVASSDWTSSTPKNLRQPAANQALEPEPQYLMAWEEGASQASPGNVIVHDGIWRGNSWVGGGTWFGSSRSSGWFGGSRGHSIHNRSVVSRGHYSSRPTVSRTRCVTPSRSACTTPARGGHPTSGHSGRPGR